MRAWTLLLLTAWLCPTGVAQRIPDGSSSTYYRDIVWKARKLLDEGRYAQADRLIEQSWALARRAGPAEPSFPTAVSALAAYYEGDGYWLKAQAVWAEGQTDLQSLGPNHLLRRQALEDFAGFLSATGTTGQG